MIKLNDKRFQIISIFICWLIYTVSYLGKYSYNANISLIETDYNVSHTQTGLVLTLFAIVYGSGQIINGILCKKYSRKYTIPIALVVSAMMNFLFFIGVPFYLVKYLWIIQAAFLSVAWPISIQVISENVGPKYMPKAILVMSTTTSVGTLFVYGISALFAKFGNYKLTFITGASALLMASFIWLLFYRKGDYSNGEDITSKESEPNITSKSKLLYIPIMLFGLLVIIANFTKDGLQSWAPVILKQLHGMPDSLSILLTLVLPIFGILGSALAVSFCKRINTYIVITILFFSVISLFNFMIMLFYNNIFILVLGFGMLELLLHGVINIIVSVFPLALRDKISSGRLSGILNGLSYVGSATSSLLLGNIADRLGWVSVFLTLFVSSCIAVFLVLTYWLVSRKITALKI